ncbi:hypothetical protein FQR65_LT02985 [Abscondita terminalis]|nr:hypothetical protein FQR65_LT02985 [Abscondita terminalis]
MSQKEKQCDEERKMLKERILDIEESMEKKDREARKNNIVIKNVECKEEGLKQHLEQVLESHIGVKENQSVLLHFYVGSKKNFFTSKGERKTLLILNRHASHYSCVELETAEANNVVLLYKTHYMQPLVEGISVRDLSPGKLLDQGNHTLKLFISAKKFVATLLPSPEHSQRKPNTQKNNTPGKKNSINTNVRKRRSSSSPSSDEENVDIQYEEESNTIFEVDETECTGCG